jgi:hypothetical protein
VTYGEPLRPAPTSWLETWAWFALWALLAGLIVLGLISFIVLLLVAVIPVGIVLILLAASSRARRSAFGALTGVGGLFLVVAYIQRDGPGTTCWHTANGGGCEEHLNPLPWFVVGLAFVIGGMVLNALYASAVQRRYDLDLRDRQVHP